MVHSLCCLGNLKKFLSFLEENFFKNNRKENISPYILFHINLERNKAYLNWKYGNRTTKGQQKYFYKQQIFLKKDVKPLLSVTNFSRLNVKRSQSTLKFHLLRDGCVEVVHKMFPQQTCTSAGSISASLETATCKMRQLSVKEQRKRCKGVN